ncbi:NAD(P)H-dependent oxidoreductase [Phormidium sp. CLA17]|uniref:NADPH-dependent FMN reductase n=1 Tax=Leptolyngbya sp. Cla-17 TaxID=2803751 RepID=UPI001491A468|nr:NAD(P)H-dependent oxidoreductase [Leptolyngbya sp. Cla-17]MBM0744494.1 NAD(P)H-dependent oxidoreductase [Leptolyngbya sp. Cla-17]
MLKILAISGSLRERSSNTAILRAAATLAPPDISISVYETLGELPHFNPDLDNETVPASVKEWRSLLKESDGVIVCTPEYAYGIPGVLKNALDWIVSSGEFINKPTAIISASPSPDGGAHAHAALIQTLAVMMATIVEGATLLIPAVSAKLNDQGEFTDRATAQALGALLNRLIKASNGVGALIALDTASPSHG